MNSKVQIILFVLILFSCKQNPVFDNPYDEDNNPDYETPETSIINNSIDGTTVETSIVTIEWEGNEFVSEYSYKYDESEWSEWTSTTSYDLEYLDEGGHSFSVKGRYINLVEDETPATVLFTVDAVKGPGLRIFPLYIEVENDDSFELYLYGEDLAEVVFAEIHIGYDQSIISLIKVGKGDLLSNDDDSILIVDQDDGEVSINIASNFTNQDGLNGTGALVKLTFNIVLIGNSEVSINTNSTFLNIDNLIIPIIDTANGIVNVK